MKLSSIALCMLAFLMIACRPIEVGRVGVTFDRDPSSLLPGEEFSFRLENGDEGGEQIFSVEIGGQELSVNAGVVVNAFTPKMAAEMVIREAGRECGRVALGKGILNIEKAFFIYMAADNNLQTAAELDVGELIRASEGKSKFAILVRIDGYLESFRDCLIFIRDGNARVARNLPESDSSNPNTLGDFLKTACEMINGDERFLSVWSHGSAWVEFNGEKMRATEKSRAICYDDHDDSWMSVRDFAREVSASGSALDALFLDACFMSQAEVVYEIRDCAEYIFASPAEMPLLGYDYGIVLDCLSQAQELESRSISIIERTIQEYAAQGIEISLSLSTKETVEALAGAVISLIAEVGNGFLPFFKGSPYSSLPRYGPFSADYDENGTDAAVLFSAAKEYAVSHGRSGSLDLISGVLLSMTNDPRYTSFPYAGMGMYVPEGALDPGCYDALSFALDTGWAEYIQESIL